MHSPRYSFHCETQAGRVDLFWSPRMHRREQLVNGVAEFSRVLVVVISPVRVGGQLDEEMHLARCSEYGCEVLHLVFLELYAGKKMRRSTASRHWLEMFA